MFLSLRHYTEEVPPALAIAAVSAEDAVSKRTSPAITRLVGTCQPTNHKPPSSGPPPTNRHPCGVACPPLGLTASAFLMSKYFSPSLCASSVLLEIFSTVRAVVPGHPSRVKQTTRVVGMLAPLRLKTGAHTPRPSIVFRVCFTHIHTSWYTGWRWRWPAQPSDPGAAEEAVLRTDDG